MRDKRKSGFWWPDVSNIEAARKATLSGMWGAIISAVVTSLFAAWSLGSGKVAAGFITAGAFIDAIVFAALAFGIYKESRVAAVICLVLFIVEKTLQISQTGQLQGAFLAIILILCFVSSVRGTFSLHKLRHVESNG